MDRNWTIHADVVVPHGINISESEIVAPYPPEVVASLGCLYIPSIVSPIEVLKLIAEEELRYLEYARIFNSQALGKDVMKTISNSPALHARLMKSL